MEVVRGYIVLSDLMINSDGDLELLNNDLKIITGVEALEQKLEIELSFLKNDWFLNVEKGIDYYSYFGQKPFNQNLLDIEIRDVIENTQGIVSLDHYVSSVNPYTRNFTVEFNVTTDYGVVEFNKNLGLLTND